MEDDSAPPPSTIEEVSSPFFQGDVSLAISKSQQEKLILLVTVQDGGEECTRMDNETWNAPEVASLLQNEMVALRLSANSVDAKNFCSLFLPTIYLIGMNGAPLKVLTGFLNSENVIKAIQEANELYKQQLTNVPPVTSPEPPQAIHSAPSPVSPPLASPQNNQSQTIPSDSNSPSTVQPSEEPSLREKQEAMRQRIEQLKAKKQKEVWNEEAHSQFEENERRREIERRKSGKEAQETLKRLQDLKAKKEAEERKKEKMEERLAKERIRKQIELDKLERRRQVSDVGRSHCRWKSTMTTLQMSLLLLLHHLFLLRSSMGTRQRLHFASWTDPLPRNLLKLLIPFRKQKILSTRRSPFRLTRWFAVTRVTPTRGKISKRELKLVPNAAVMIVPTEQGAPSPLSQDQGVMSYVSSVTSFLGSFLGFGGQSSATPPPAEAPSPSLPASRQPSRNIHGLRQGESDGDESNHYWNGNSTQQQ